MHAVSKQAKQHANRLCSYVIPEQKPKTPGPTETIHAVKMKAAFEILGRLTFYLHVLEHHALRASFCNLQQQL